jgi:hypothetical protein
LQRIGFDHVRGVLRGMQRWLEARYATASYPHVSADLFAAAVAEGHDAHRDHQRERDEQPSSPTPPTSDAAACEQTLQTSVLREAAEGENR